MKLIESLSYKPVELAFGTSGLRGLVTDMTDLECYINARGFMTYLKTIEEGLEKVYIAGDLRDSTPRIMQVVARAITDEGLEVVNCGHIPTPAVAAYALAHNAPSIMVTGSHIPADRNGIKFYKSSGEVLKSDESPMQAAVAVVRTSIYGQNLEASGFNSDGSFTEPTEISEVQSEARDKYIQRYTSVFDSNLLKDRTVVVYQHSAVGRDLLVQVLELLGANVVPVDRSDSFVSIDTENVTADDKTLFKSYAASNKDVFAIVSTDGDSDRPFMIDETGEFYRGDVLGLVVSDFLGAKFAAVPISANDAVNEFTAKRGIEKTSTKIGSPYVIEAMNRANIHPAVGWEVNGGYLTGDDIEIGDSVLSALPTRDAFLPILAALAFAIQNNKKLSEVFASLPARFTGGGLIDNVPEDQIAKFRELSTNVAIMQSLADKVFAESGFGAAKLDITDGFRLEFESGDTIHLRPSGNAPQFRVYTNAVSQDRADDLVAQALDEKGYIAVLLQELAAL